MICKPCVTKNMIYDQSKCKVQQQDSIVCIPTLMKKLNCIIACQGSGIFLHTLYLIHQLLIGLKKIIIGLRLLTRPSPLTRTQDTICISKTPNKVNILNMILLFSGLSCGFHPQFSFPQLRKKMVLRDLFVYGYIYYSKFLVQFHMHVIK